MISFNVPPYIGTEEEYIKEAIKSGKICGDGNFTQRCNEWLKDYTKTSKALLTTSCTQAIEMAAILADIQLGDEIICPSFTFVSTANAFVLRGAKIIFVDIRPDTMNMDEKLIENAISENTKAIVPVHYAGVACEMDTIMDIAQRQRLTVIEDAAQGIMSTYKGKALGTMGDFGCYSFHETKNFSMGEGGALLIRDAKKIERAEIIREKGTNRSKFFRGEIDKYTWVDMGSSYLPSELNAAYLWAQLQRSDEIYDSRMKSWNLYYEGLSCLMDIGYLELPTVPQECTHNAHIFYIKTRTLEERDELLGYLKKNEVGAVFHYIPLHTSPVAEKFSEFRGSDKYTTAESNRLLRLPMYYGIEEDKVEQVIKLVKRFFI